MKTKAKVKGGLFTALKHIFTPKRYVSAIILVGGSAQRFGGTTPKQFLTLGDRPVAAVTMAAFEKAPSVKEIIIVCREQDTVRYEVMAKEYGITKFKQAVIGGATRQESSLKGLDAADKKSDYVMIHDGARPLVTVETIEAVAVETKKHRAACAARISRDTVKIADEKGFIARTEDRNFVYLAETPQGFYKPLLEACAYSAQKEGIEVTDDASLLEHYCYPVKLVDSGSENLKITTPSDLVLAAAVLESRKTSESEEAP